MIIDEGVSNSSHNYTLGFISCLIAHSSSNRVKDSITKDNVLRTTPQNNRIISARSEESTLPSLKLFLLLCLCDNSHVCLSNPGNEKKQ